MKMKPTLTGFCDLPVFSNALSDGSVSIFSCSDPFTKDLKSTGGLSSKGAIASTINKGKFSQSELLKVLGIVQEGS